MRQRVTIVYNQPQVSRYDAAHEEKAVLGVLDEVAAVRQSLAELQYEVALLPLVPPVEAARTKLERLATDLVFNLFEGFAGDPESEALVPMVLEHRRVPYTGCPAEVLRLGLDKVNVKVMLRAAGVPTPDFQVLNPKTLDSFRMDFPCIVKPRRDDASHGISDASVVHDKEQLSRQVQALSAAYPTGVLVEQFLPGREFNATVMGNGEATVLPVSEIVYTLPEDKPKLLTFAAKWETNSPEYAGTNAVCPAEVTPEEMDELRETARTVFNKLAGRGYARVDMRRDDAGSLYVLEINPNPDISPEAGAAIQAGAAGLSYTDFIAGIVKLAGKAAIHAG